MEALYNSTYWKNTFNSVTNARLILRMHFYTQDIINHIIETIQNTFETFTVNYNSSDSSIIIKIKKTNLKKNDNLYVHSAQYYYPYINNIMNETFNAYGAKDLLKNNECITESLYNLTTLLDNIIVIHL